MDKLAAFLGIASPINMLFLFRFLFIEITILALTVALFFASYGVKRHTQKITLLDKRMKELEKGIKL